MKIYPRANENRVTGSHPSVRVFRKNFFKAAGFNFLMMQILFLGLFSYIFGSLFQQNSHIHNLNILFVDYDGGVIGHSVRDAYSILQGNDFPTLIERPATEFSTPKDLETEIYRSRYWAAVYVSPAASGRLQAALSGDSTYNNSDIMAYIWNEARYPAISDSFVVQNIQMLLSAARVILVSNKTGALYTLSTSSSSALSAFSNPWQPASFNIMPTMQGSRLIYNTLVIILILLQEFFYLGTINSLCIRFNLYHRFIPGRIIFYRIGISAAYTFIGSLCTTGAIWAFRANWEVNSNQFALTWASLWLFAHVNFLIFDIFTVWLPPLYIPMSLVSWVIFNVTSVLLPFELVPGFYHWSYAMPANAVYRILIDIWSGGYTKLHITLPVLFSLEALSLFLSSLGVYRRCHYAAMADNVEQKAFREQLDTALSLESGQGEEIQNKTPTVAKDLLSTIGGQASRQIEEREGGRLDKAIHNEDDKLRED